MREIRLNKRAVFSIPKDKVTTKEIWLDSKAEPKNVATIKNFYGHFGDFFEFDKYTPIGYFCEPYIRVSTLDGLREILAYYEAHKITYYGRSKNIHRLMQDIKNFINTREK